jgi:hypothetical protein
VPFSCAASDRVLPVVLSVFDQDTKVATPDKLDTNKRCQILWVAGGTQVDFLNALSIAGVSGGAGRFRDRLCRIV